MKKNWALVALIAIILVVGFSLIGYLKFSKKNVAANPLPSDGQKVAGSQSAAYFDDNAKVMFFYSDYCHWCQKEKDEVLTPLAAQGYRVKPMNVGNQPELAKQYNINGTPTFIAANGEQLVGFKTIDDLKPWLESHK